MSLHWDMSAWGNNWYTYAAVVLMVLLVYLVGRWCGYRSVMKKNGRKRS